MITLTQIQQPIADSLERFNSFICEEFRAENNILAEMLHDALTSRGKGVRPMIVMLSAALCSKSGAVTRRADIAAMMVEMIHLASLIHDDVLDDALLRRGKPSLNAKWQSKRAVLAGDYILARNLSVGMASGQFDIVSHIVGTIATLCEGEVIQDDCARRHTMSREEYLSIISKKTAALISVSASAGAKAAGAPHEVVNTMAAIGRAIGMAFQIQDDILDYTPSTKSGKKLYQDIGEGKITLPLLIPLEQASEQIREQILEDAKSAVECDAALDRVVEFVGQNHGVEMATEVMHQYINRAIGLLSDFPESEYRAAFINLCAFICERDK